MKARTHIKTAVRASDKAIGWVVRQFLSPKPFIDANWYSRRYLDGDASDPFHHYMKIGWKLGYRPNPFLDALWYRRRYGCVGNPLLHYIRRGARHPHPLFDARWYLERYPDVARRRCDPLLHFLCFGRYEGRSPHPLFNSEWYAARYAQDGAADDPFLHYLEKGAAGRLDPHPLFDAAWYVEHNPEIAATGACALTHFVEEGGLRGRSPHPLFDAGWYLRQYPDVAQAKVNPLTHYLQAGASEGRDPHPHFQTSWRRDAYLGDGDANPLLHFVESDDIGAKPNFIFDPIWYERTHRHLIPEGERPLSHFLRIGRFAGLRPGPFFDPHAYGLSTKTQAADPLAAFLHDVRLGHGVERASIGRMLLAPLSLTPAPTKRPNWPRVAVHVHAFYLDLAPKLAGALAHIPFPFDLYVTITNPNGRETVEHIFSAMPRLERLQIIVTENRGRDIAPFLVACGEALAHYEYILHLHTKKSLHNERLSGWLDYLIETLLGSPENVAALIGTFESKPNLGVLYPATYAPVRPFMRLGGNASAAQTVLKRIGVRPEAIDPLVYSSFPSGSMCWMRGEVMRSMNRLGLAWGDFPEESGQVDGTMAHAIERRFPIFALNENLDSAPYVSDLFDEAGAWRARDDMACDVLMIDHDIGGGANIFLQSLIAEYQAQNRSVIRLYRDPTLGRPVYEEIRPGSRRFLLGAPGESFGQAFARCRPKEVVINSLYGIYRELGGFVAALENMRKGNDAPVRLMMHDFLLACPSQHLLDASQKYCGLPAIESVKCRECVCLNENIAPEWRETFQMSTWRLLSQSLIDLCDEVRVFDETGEEILSRIFDIPTHIRRIAPHRPSRTLRPVRILNRDRLTIAILGTLTFAKGLDVVNSLARHARMKRLDCAIVVIGDVRATVDPFVQVHGAYEAQRLPDIMEAYGINLVFISSVVPETFCYALSEAMEMRMPIVAHDLGAQGRRVRRYERGMVIAPDSPVEEIFRSLAACWRRFAVTAAEERAL
ncbi:MAG: rhamnan synthesis F family protein [Methylocystis sp.]|uniref:rhamnan synthesis F family protein n=1 Tax=Methylocystis sp. TaxID=1911079 RepID=UPI003DA2AC74